MKKRACGRDSTRASGPRHIKGGRDSLRRMNGLVVEHFDPAAIPISNPLTIPLSRIDRL